MSIADISDERLGGQRREHERTPPHDLLAEQSALGGMLLSKDAVADVIETLRGGRLLRSQARADLRGRAHALLARRADRCRRGHRRADQDRRAAARGRRRLPAHAHLDRADRGERRLLRLDRLRARAAAPTRRRRHAHRADGLLGPGRSARPRQQRAGRDLRRHRRGRRRGLRAARGRRRAPRSTRSKPPAVATAR